jgi:hypothetical protein
MRTEVMGEEKERAKPGRGCSEGEWKGRHNIMAIPSGRSKSGSVRETGTLGEGCFMMFGPGTSMTGVRWPHRKLGFSVTEGLAKRRVRRIPEPGWILGKSILRRDEWHELGPDRLLWSANRPLACLSVNGSASCFKEDHLRRLGKAPMSASILDKERGAPALVFLRL